jgi:hypothetical protein
MRDAVDKDDDGEKWVVTKKVQLLTVYLPLQAHGNARTMLFRRFSFSFQGNPPCPLPGLDVLCPAYIERALAVP